MKCTKPREAVRLPRPPAFGPQGTLQGPGPLRGDEGYRWSGTSFRPRGWDFRHTRRTHSIEGLTTGKRSLPGWVRGLSFSELVGVARRAVAGTHFEGAWRGRLIHIFLVSVLGTLTLGVTGHMVSVLRDGRTSAIEPGQTG